MIIWLVKSVINSWKYLESNIVFILWQEYYEHINYDKQQIVTDAICGHINMWSGGAAYRLIVYDSWRKQQSQCIQYLPRNSNIIFIKNYFNGGLYMQAVMLCHSCVPLISSFKSLQLKYSSIVLCIQFFFLQFFSKW